MRSATFAGPTSPAILIGTDTVALERRIDDSTIVVRAPQAHGRFGVTLGSGRSLGHVDIHGYQGSFVGPVAGGVLLPWPSGSRAPTYLANSLTGLVLVDLERDVATPVAGAVHNAACGRGPGTARRANTVLLAGPDCRVGLWELTPPRQVDSAPYRVSSHADVQLGTGLFLSGSAHRVCQYGSAVKEPKCYLGESVDGFRLSPRGDRVVPYYAFNRTGLLVFDAGTADTAFTVPGELYAGGAAFSPAGDTLFLAGGGVVGRLFALDAGTGALLGSDSLGFQPEDVVLDPDRGFVYVFGWTVVGQYYGGVITSWLAVMDRSTLRIVARITGPVMNHPYDGALCLFCFNRLILDARRRIVFAVSQEGYVGVRPIRVAEFSLLP